MPDEQVRLWAARVCIGAVLLANVQCAVAFWLSPAAYAPMFDLAGFRASVGNASSELKAASDFVAMRSYGNGFAEIVEHMISHDIFE